MCGRMMVIVVAMAVLGLAQAQSNFATNQLTTPGIGERAQRALFPDVTGSFLLPIATGLPTANVVNNAAGRQLQGDKSAFPFLATLPNQGSAVFITTLRPCGLINYHVHPRATEQYLVLSGTMQGGIAEENGGRQNLTFNVQPGQSMVVPQGLLHYNANKACRSLVFLQIFNSADAGTISVGNAISALTKADFDPQVLGASNTGVNATTSQFGAFALDQACLARCGLPATGGNSNDLSPEMQALLGLASSPAASPAASAGR